jgi:glycosyltransferase involved in cell wall biosynthesis
MAMLETMSYGKPVLATQAGGVPEVVKKDKNGFLFPVGDIKAFVTKLQFLLANPALTDRTGLTAKQTAHTQFGAKKIVQEYLEFYNNTLLEN